MNLPLESNKSKSPMGTSGAPCPPAITSRCSKVDYMTLIPVK